MLGVVIVDEHIRRLCLSLVASVNGFMDPLRRRREVVVLLDCWCCNYLSAVVFDAFR